MQVVRSPMKSDTTSYESVQLTTDVVSIGNVTETRDAPGLGLISAASTGVGVQSMFRFGKFATFIPSES